MRLLRSLVNLVILTVHLVRLILFGIARVCGSWVGGAALVGATIILIERDHAPTAYAYLPMAFAAVCHVAYPRLRVRSGPRLLKGPLPSAKPPPSASTAKGRADDPNEATVIGRLDPKLRDMLRRKTSEIDP